MKMKIVWVFVPVIYLTGISNASDNQENVSEYLNNENITNTIADKDLGYELIKSNLLSNNSFAGIAQNGTSHQAKITQFNKSGKSGPNRACIVQGGDENSAVITQMGEDNTNIILQCGNSNSGIQETVGNRNLALLEQFGYNNRSVQVISGNDLSNIIVQQGSDNQLYREETGQGGLGYRILQDGNGMRMTVINGR
jgi:hypothetical protein